MHPFPDGSRLSRAKRHRSEPSRDVSRFRFVTGALAGFSSCLSGPGPGASGLRGPPVTEARHRSQVLPRSLPPNSGAFAPFPSRTSMMVSAQEGGASLRRRPLFGQTVCTCPRHGYGAVVLFGERPCPASPSPEAFPKSAARRTSPVTRFLMTYMIYDATSSSGPGFASRQKQQERRPR